MRLASFEGQIPNLDYEIFNPAVDVFGDTAIFTYQVVACNPGSGAFAAEWNTTEVRTMIDGEWKILHTRWSPMTLPDALAGGSLYAWPRWGGPKASWQVGASEEHWDQSTEGGPRGAETHDGAEDADEGDRAGGVRVTC